MTEMKTALSIEEAADYTGIGRNTLFMKPQNEATGRSLQDIISKSLRKAIPLGNVLKQEN